jgi:hypothetical protein
VRTSEIDGVVRAAAVTAVASGIERHGPDAVGIVLKGVPMCALVVTVHYALGVSVSHVGTGSAAVAVAYYARQWTSAVRQPR